MAVHDGGVGGGAVEVCSALRSDIFPVKNVKKSSQRVSDGVMGEGSRGFTRDLKIL